VAIVLDKLINLLIFASCMSLLEGIRKSTAISLVALSLTLGCVKSDGAQTLDHKLNREKIAFVSDRDGNPDIYLMNTDGSDQVNVTRNKFYQAYPSWNHKGDRIAYLCEEIEPRGSSIDGIFASVFLMNVDGSSMKFIGGPKYNIYAVRIFNSRPSWSPDDTFLALNLWQNYQATVAIADTACTMTKGFFLGPGDKFSPTWSPYGKIIGYIDPLVGTDIQHDEIRAVFFNLDNGKASFETLSNLPGKKSCLSWSPDGKYVAFIGGEKGKEDIYVVDVKTKENWQLTTTTFEEKDPCWSPDSKQIAFASNRNDNWDIYSMDIETRREQRLTTDPAKDVQPSWSPKP